MTAEIRIYVANLAKYNAGVLSGTWIDLPAVDLWEQVNSILGDDEEYAIHDYEAPFSISECANLDELNNIAEHLDKDYDLERFTYLVGEGHDFDYALQHYEDVTFYQNMNLEEVAEEMVDEGLFGDIADSIKCYIDYSRIARDLSFDGYTETDNGVFCYH